MSIEQPLSNPVSDEAKRQHVAEANNEFVYGGTPAVVEKNVSSETEHFGGVEHNLKEDQQ